MDEPQLRWARTTLDAATRASALAMLSDLELQRHDGMPATQRDTFLAGRLLLRGMVAELTGIAPMDVPLVARCPDCGGSHGAPVVEGSDIAVSLARTDDFVVAAAQWGGRVGVDVERLDQSAERLDAIAALTGERSIRRWTRVEAVLKADGRGLRVDPRDVVFDGDRATIVRGSVVYRMRDSDLLPGHSVSIASVAPQSRSGQPWQRRGEQPR